MTAAVRKRCPQCKKLRDIESFPWRSGKRSNQRDSWCRLCRNKYHSECMKGNLDWQREYREENRQRIGMNNRKSRLKLDYGLTWEEYEGMIEKQEGKCALCRIKPVSSEVRRRNESRSAIVDHDHVTGKVRGILCTACNLLIGYAQDDPVILRRAIKYLEED